MDLTPYVDRLRSDLTAAAAATDPATQQAAERLTAALEPAVRLALMEALSQAADEITTELPAGSVELRLAGRELDFVVELPPPAEPAEAPSAAPEEEDDAEGAVTRITLRLPEAVKARAEELAGRGGQSLNTWIVAAVRAATRQGGIRVDVDLSSLPFGGGFPTPPGPPDPPGGRRRGSRRMTGWA